MAGFAIEYEPRLVEEAVLRALRGHADERAFRKERDRLYEIAEPQERETRFREFHAAWFERLGLHRRVSQALRERRAIVANIARGVVAYAASGWEEGAELCVSSENGSVRRSMIIRLRPEMFALLDRLRFFLRHELTHIADMLDPRFGYEPRFPASEAGPTRERLLRDRYRVLWDAFIDGRLLRLGRAPAGIRADRLADFARVFPALRERTEGAFARFFDGTAVTHAELVAFAVDPKKALGREPDRPYPGEPCPLCEFPTHAFEPEPEQLPPDVVAQIQQHLPGWSPTAGLCQQCADLCRSRSFLRSAMKEFPSLREGTKGA